MSDSSISTTICWLLRARGLAACTFMPGVGRAAAAGGQRALARDLDHAGAAVAVGAQAVAVAQVRESPRRGAARLSDGFAGRAVTGWPSSSKATPGSRGCSWAQAPVNTALMAGPLRAVAPLPAGCCAAWAGRPARAFTHFVRKVLVHAADGVGRRLAQAADGGIGHHLRQVVQQCRHPRLRRCISAPPWPCPRGRACTGRSFRVQEAHHVQRRIARRSCWLSTMTAAEPMKQP
jgi:hypothetical protein